MIVGVIARGKTILIRGGNNWLTLYPAMLKYLLFYLIITITGCPVVEFEWDPAKANKNFHNHRVNFSEAVTVFRDPLGITIYDPDHSVDEDRFITIGISVAGRVLLISHTDRNDRVRLISARELSRSERENYENEIKRRRTHR
jgi:uncharacterized DUF497 family protein